MKNGKVLIILFFCVLIVSCRGRVSEKKYVEDSVPDSETLIKANQVLVRDAERQIKEQARLSGWKLTPTGTGVFYQVYGDGGGSSSNMQRGGEKKLIKPGDWVSLTYSVRLLNGSLCYESTARGPKQFAVEKSQAEAGMHEAVQFLHPGDSARIILPPHRAFGMIGDGDKIPGMAILWYEIRVDSVRPADKI